MSRPDRIDPDRPAESEQGDPSGARRTSLANERTQLAWWRTGLTAIAVALGIGRILPELAQDEVNWPYTVVGVGFAIYGIVLIGYGTRRWQGREPGVGRLRVTERPLAALTLAGIGLGVAAAILIVV